MKYATRLVVLGLVLVAGCAPKRTYVAAPVPDWDVVEGLGLGVPEALSGSARRDFEAGWAALRQGRLETAVEELEDLRPRFGGVPEVATALGFLELRLGNRAAAESHFQTALESRRPYGPAESGLLLAALARSEEDLAYERLERLAENYPDHALVDRHGVRLRVNVAESRLRTARELASTGRHEEAAQVYLDALEVAPEAGSLYLETARAELAAGLFDRAAIHAGRATELEPGNEDAFQLLGEAAYAKGDLVGAVEAYRKAAELDPRDPELRARREALEAEFDREHLPPEYAEVPRAERLTREQLAALLYFELRRAVEEAGRSTTVIATDISDSWASEAVRRVLAAGILEVFPNHTFQPEAFVTRVELARALESALEVLAPEAHRLALQSAGLDENFPDLPRENIDYDAAALAVSLGLLPLAEGGTFDPQRFVSGAEGSAAVDALVAHVTH